MRVSAINFGANTQFQGHQSDKKNTLKNTAGAAAIALVSLAPSGEANAQHYHYHPIMPHTHYVVPTPVMNVPKCFIYGDVNNENYEKNMRDVFSEIDSQIEPNGQISVNEVVKAEERNWNSTHYYPMSRQQKVMTANLVKHLASTYNDSNSNPRTINYNEYRNIMDTYMTSKNIANFIDLMRIISVPQHHHHHHRHR